MTYRELYFYLFGQMAQAVDELEQGRVPAATERLISAQRKAEEEVMKQDIFPEQ